MCVGVGVGRVVKTNSTETKRTDWKLPERALLLKTVLKSEMVLFCNSVCPKLRLVAVTGLPLASSVDNVTEEV